MSRNIGFVSFRFSGTDGVSLETAKWAQVLEQRGDTCHWFAGELNTPDERSMLVPQAHFNHAEVEAISRESFGATTRTRSLTGRIHQLREELKDSLHTFIERYAVDVLIPQNALAIPMNVPLGMALTELIAETGIVTVAHHHDFAWERDRFARTAIGDILSSSYPPALERIRNVVINSAAQQQLALRRGVSSTLVPNVMDFDVPVRGVDEFNSDLRERLGVRDDEWFILQPTRIVPRKGIEHAVELVASLSSPAALVVSHAAGDEGYAYRARLERFAKALGVRMVFADGWIADERSEGSSDKRFDLADAYAHADFVTYPSLVEGFGNAFLEAVQARKPILVNRYPVYEQDIRPLGFDVVEMNGMVDADTVAQVESFLASPARRQEAAEKNFALAKTHFSYDRLEELLYRLM